MKLTLNEIKQKVGFLCNAESLKSFGSKKIEEILLFTNDKRITITIIDTEMIINKALLCNNWV